MAARIIDGKALAQRIRNRIADEVRHLAASGVQPGLAVVLVGQDPASQIYVRNKTKACAEAGFRTFDYPLGAQTSEAELHELIRALNANPAVDGILVQLPLPPQVDSRRLLLAIDPGKDVDGFHPENLGRLLVGEPGFVACTPAGVMRLLAEAGAQLSGARAVVVGRSNIVGKPMALLLLAADATVTLCHSRTRDLAREVAGADVLVAALGRPRSDPRKLDQRRRGGHRRRNQPPRRRQAGGRRGIRRRRRASRGHHPGSRRRGTDDHRDVAGEHAALGQAARGTASNAP